MSLCCHPGNTLSLKFTSCHGHVNLFAAPFRPVPHVWVGVVSPHSEKGLTDRTCKQPAFISVRETWQQRAQLPGCTTSPQLRLALLSFLSSSQRAEEELRRDIKVCLNPSFVFYRFHIGSLIPKWFCWSPAECFCKKPVI